MNLLTHKSRPLIHIKIISLCLFIAPTFSFAQATMDYTTSVKVNNIELNQAISANLVENIVGKSTTKISKEYSECTGNYEYSTQLQNGHFVKFEIFAEDNPQIKSENFYKAKNNFQQLGTTKGQVWLTLNTSNLLKDKVLINQKLISSPYTLTQFKKDFPISSKNNNTNVLMLSATEVKPYLKKPNDFDAGYTAFVSFKFKNGQLNQLEINRGIAC